MNDLLNLKQREMKKKGLLLAGLGSTLLSLSSFTIAYAQAAQEVATSGGELDIISNPWSQFGALGLLVAMLAWVIKRQENRMEERDKRNDDLLRILSDQHASERREWTDANKAEAAAINNLTSVLSELKGKISG